MIDFAQIASTVVTVVSPFLPYLLESGKAIGQKLAEAIAEKGGEAAWSKAQAIWGKISSRFGDDAEVKGAAQMVSSKPGDESYQFIFAKVLGTRLQEDPQFAQELLQLTGGSQAVQEVLAERKSWVKKVKQEMKKTGIQRVKAIDSSSVEGVIQRQ